MAKETDREDIFLKMVVSMKDSGKMIKRMALVLKYTRMVRNMRACSKMTSAMDKAQTHGQMVKNMKGPTKMTIEKARVVRLTKTGITTMESGKIIGRMVKELGKFKDVRHSQAPGSTHGQMKPFSNTN